MAARVFHFRYACMYGRDAAGWLVMAREFPQAANEYIANARKSIGTARWHLSHAKLFNPARLP